MKECGNISVLSINEKTIAYVDFARLPELAFLIKGPVDRVTVLRNSQWSKLLKIVAHLLLRVTY